MTKNSTNGIYQREEILEVLSSAISNLDHKITKGRITNPENEKIRINQYKTLAYSCHTYNNILKDKQLDNLAKELENIKLALTNNEVSEDTKSDIEIVESIIEKLEAKT